MKYGLPEKHGLYDPANEKDACGVGFVAQIKGVASHQIIKDANRILCNMDHRGARGSETNTGDGAGILTAVPDKLLRRVAKEELGIDLPEPGKYGVGNIFLPTDDAERAYCKAAFLRSIETQGQRFLGWRSVPTDPDGANLGPTAAESMPHIEQLFIGAADGLDQDAFERQLYAVRKSAASPLRVDESLKQRTMLYACSLSSRTIIYKGMLACEQVLPFYGDLTDPDYETHLAMVHSRFATNTFPTWERSQPLRCLSHNGEINTLRGNKNAMHSRQGVVEGELFGDDLRKLFPVAEPGLSDSGTLDNVLEFLYMNGRTMAEAAMLMIPEAWQRHEDMPQVKRDFYLVSHGAVGWSCFDCLHRRYGDRGPSRPKRASSEPLLPHPRRPCDHGVGGRRASGPARDGEAQGTAQARTNVPDRLRAGTHDSRRRAQERHRVATSLRRVAQRTATQAHRASRKRRCARVRPRDAPVASFGYTTETMQFMLRPMIEQQRDPVGSMGNDSALAVLSDQPRLAYDYFKQLFAQVTNPPIDSIREEVIMAVECYIGPEKNLLTTTPEHAHRLRIPHPILTNEEVNAVKTIDERGWRSKIIDVTWPRSEGAEGLEPAIQRIRQEAEQAVDEGYSLIVLTDRATGKDRIPVSALLATGAAHHHLVATEKRTRVGIVVETGEAREVHHHCCLVGYGADAINPYLAFEALWQERRLGTLDAETFADDDSIVTGYRKAVAKGMLKVFAKMGISTLQSYKGAQIFEAVGLNSSVVDLCFAGTASRIQGIGFNVIAQELVDRHELGYPGEDEPRLPILPNDGQFHWRAKGERHMWNPETIANLQVAARSNSSDAYKRFAEQVNDNARDRATLRGLMRFKKGQGVPLSEVEPASEIVKRFATGAMSFGSISVEAHSTLAIAMNELGGKSNTGEGGEDPERYLPLPDGSMNPMRSAIKQVASGRFGVTINYLTNADELQIKMAQGAKPGEGGELPGRKVDEKIASVRHSTPGVGLISPPPHHDIYSIEDLSQLIHDLKNSNPSARISVKLVSEVGVGTIAAGVSKAHADHILISGHDGGTGASPLTSIKHAGLPWELGISETHQTLVMNDLRSRVVLQTDGQMKTGRDVVIAGLLGAEEIGLSTAPLVAMGCIMMRKCHLNTCPVGVATQDPELRKKFKGKPEHVINYLFMVAEEAREIMASLGFRTFNEMVGRVDMLDTVDAIVHWKAQGIDLTPILTPARKKNAVTVVYYTKPQDHGLDKALDNRLIELAQPAITEGKPVRAELKIKNTNRTVGTMLSHEIAKVWGEELLPDETVRFKFEGSAGQSFGAWLAKGVTLEIEGDANDYVGKGLSGGKIIVYPSKKATFVPAENMIVGNVVLYGAVSGKAFFRGRAAERFCVRNSGAWAVIEGVGDHACEYMTGGRAVILGDTGRNFGAGMSGGVAYVLDTNNDFASKCNQEMVELGRLEYQEEIAIVKGLIEEHFEYTDSAVAERLLQDWDNALRTLVKVMPIDYERVLRQTGDLSVGVPGPDLAQPQDRPAAE